MQTQLWIFHRNLDSLGDHGATVFFFSCFRRTRPHHQVETCKVDLCEDGVSYDFQVVILRPVTYIDILYLMKFSLEGTNNLTSKCSFSFFSVLQKQPPVQLQETCFLGFLEPVCHFGHLSLFLFLFLGSVLLGQRLCSYGPSTKSGSHGNSLAPHQQPPAPTCFTCHLSFISSLNPEIMVGQPCMNMSHQNSKQVWLHPLSPGITVGYIARLPHGAGLCQWHAPSLCGCAAMCLSFRSQSREPQQPGLPQRNLDAESMRVWEFIGWTWNC